MQNILLFDTETAHANLLPIAYTRPVADFRVGILTLRKKWEMRLPASYSYKTVDSLADIYPAVETDVNLYVNGSLLPDDNLVDAVSSLRAGHALWHEGELLALCGSAAQYASPDSCVTSEYTSKVRMLHYVFDIFLLNAEEIEADFMLITKGRESQPLPQTNLWTGPRFCSDGVTPGIFIEPGAKIEGATLNTTSGPVYIGAGAEIMEGALIKGPFSLGEHSVVKMGARIYTGTTVGPWCKVGGEISNAVIFGYSNKAHDGFLGNAVIGEWCNIGAGTNASNLKNDYARIRVWNYAARSFMRTDLQFCGLIMADHSRIGINGMLNTATVIGVGVNLHGSGFPRTFIPSFSKGSPAGGFSDLGMDEFLAMAGRMMERRGITLSDKDRMLFNHVARQAKEFKR